jgi:hypothetical protein
MSVTLKAPELFKKGNVNNKAQSVPELTYLSGEHRNTTLFFDLNNPNRHE